LAYRPGLSRSGIANRRGDPFATVAWYSLETRLMIGANRTRKVCKALGLALAGFLLVASPALAGGHRRYARTVYMAAAPAPVVYTAAPVPVAAAPVAFVRQGPVLVAAPAPYVVPATRLRAVRTTVYVAEPVNVVYRPFYVYP
jgi:hypothetical protein